MATTWSTRHFEEWEDQLSQAIGHHSSTLLTPEVPFCSSITVRQAEGVAAVSLEGKSSLRLHRWQPPGQLLLWLPQQGWVQDRINGQQVLAEPGTAMLCLPGDELLGETSRYLKGVSILLPSAGFGRSGSTGSLPGRHLAQGSEVVALIDTAHQLLAALRAGAPDAPWLAGLLADHLLFWRDLAKPPPSERSLGAVERRHQIRRARDWIEAHLHRPLRVTELADALHLSTRSLQFTFRQELGRSPPRGDPPAAFAPAAPAPAHRPARRGGDGGPVSAVWIERLRVHPPAVPPVVWRNSGPEPDSGRFGPSGPARLVGQ